MSMISFVIHPSIDFILQVNWGAGSNPTVCRPIRAKPDGTAVWLIVYDVEV